jgi:hypothetical protein
MEVRQDRAADIVGEVAVRPGDVVGAVTRSWAVSTAIW